jgi:DNA-binding transcriptional ArsR family regulator
MLARRTSPVASLRELRIHFQGLASLTRLRILELLAGISELTVQDLADALVISQPRLSWHLRMLRRGRLVNARRAGREVFYSIDREGFSFYQQQLTRLISPAPRVEQPGGEMAEAGKRGSYERSEA